MEREQRVEMFMQLYANHRELYQRHMKTVFRELCAYQDLICSRRARLLEHLEHPWQLPGKLLAKTARAVRRFFTGGNAVNAKGIGPR